ncbi:phosphate ABC transporter ATP-binding protein [Bacillus dakarensis]|uniref:ABC transporter ATP-binding protein n=1 Tax=Robertmurraya dakarensis TaxID=1926278 RepID=UPI0009FD7752
MYALRKVSGTVTKGSILTIIGPSGSGKSTILSLCNLLSTPDEGEIYVGEKEIREWNIQELRRYVGIAFQSAPMLAGTVEENLCLPLKLRGQSLEEPEKYLDFVGLSKDLLTREAKELSGGQRQRLSLARTLVNKPSVLLLDEVTSALDSISSQEIEELIMRINAERQTTIIWVTHDLNQAKRVGTQTWMVMEGSLVESGPTELFFSQPKDNRTKEFLHNLMRDSQ